MKRDTVLKKIFDLSMYLKLRPMCWRIFGREVVYKSQTNAKIFDDIYTYGTWGRDEEGNPSSGRGSHDGKIINPYIDLVKALLKEKDVSVIIDLGCGDFNVGKHFINHSKKYIACDVSEAILNKNRKIYSFDNVEFRQVDLTQDALPDGDIVLVRQVLQHLSNTNITNFVQKLNKNRPYKYLLITEHLPGNEKFIPNIDKGTDAQTRLSVNSGVELHKEPFRLLYKRKQVLLEVPASAGGVGSVIRSTLYEV